MGGGSMLTAKQRNLLAFIEWNLSRDGKAPSYKAMRRHLGLHSAIAVDDLLGQLEAKGYIRHGKFRGVTVLRELDAPRAAPAHFPYYEHRTVAQVWAGDGAAA